MKKILLPILSALFSLSFSAFSAPLIMNPKIDFISDEGLAYFINDDGESVTVTYLNLYYNYTPEQLIELQFDIPEVIKHDGKDYIVSAIGDSAFIQSLGVTEIKLPNTIKTVGKCAFTRCGYLKEIVFPKETRILDGCDLFEACESLERFVLPETQNIISVDMFSSCLKLTNVEIPNTVKVIDLFAFSGCINLERVVIPASVDSISKAAFLGCDKLSIIYSKNEVPPAAVKETFSRYSAVSLFVPRKSVGSYKNDEVWGRFESIEAIAIHGDCNSDDFVNIGDVSATYYEILGNNASPTNCDINDDGAVNIGDISSIYDIILYGEDKETTGMNEKDKNKTRVPMHGK